MSLILDIRKLILNTPKEKMFRETCFGWMLDIPNMQESGVLVHYFLCHQVACQEGDTNTVPLRYRVRTLDRLGEVEIQFGREEFCLVTGLRFGVDFRQSYMEGANLLRRRVFPSTIDSRPIYVGDLLAMINKDVFKKLTDKDGVRLCLLAVLKLVLEGTEHGNIVDGFLFRLVEDLDMWNVFPWGSYVWPTLYNHLRDAVFKRRDKHFSADRDPTKPPKYTLNGFLWSFKVCH